MTGPGEIERLYRSHGGLVLRRARAILGNEADAREAMQDVFAELVRAPRSLDGVRSVVGWLYRATTHRCLKVLRDRRSGARLLRRHAAGSRPALAVAEGELAVEARSLLATLPDEEAAALVYHHVDGMSHAEVAELLGCSPRKVGYLIERAHGVLLQEEEGPV